MSDSKDILVWSCAHADPEVDNERFNWLGDLISDTKPDLVVDLGDGADMRSLNSFDGARPKNLVANSYERDIDCYNDSQERLRHRIKKNKKKRPQWVGFAGNHEHRIQKAIDQDPRLEGRKHGISPSHLQTSRWFDEYHPYLNGGPAIANYYGTDFAHFFSSGNFGSATSGVHHAYSVINNRHSSSVCGHSHKRDLYFKDGPGSIGMVVGCFKGHEESWAGQANKDWWKGVVLMKNVDEGRFEPQFISLEMLKREYSK